MNRKRLLHIITACVIVCLTATLFAFNASAASASLWFTDPTVTVGNNVSVVVDVKGDSLGGHQMNITYDTSFLQFVSATGNTNWFSGVDKGGVIQVSDMTNSGSVTKMSFTLTFKTKKTGTTTLNPSGVKFFSGSGDELTHGAIGYSAITIKPVPEASSDATLKGLTIGNGVLTPVFSPNVTEYSTVVDFSVKSIAVSAIKNHNGASVYVSGNDSLAVGDNAIVVTVTAENGTKKIYTIKVTRGKNPLSTDVFVTLGEGVTAEVSKTVDVNKVPKGFDVVLLTLEGVEVNAIRYDEHGIPAVYLLGNDKVPEGFYFVDVQNMTATPFEYLAQTQNSLMMLDVKLVEAPEDYELGTFTIDGKSVEALVPSNVEEPNHCLVYAIGAMGQKTLYIYDPVEKTYQRFAFAELGVEEEEETTEPEPDKNDTPETKDPAIETEKNEESNEDDGDSIFKNNIFTWVFIGIAILIIALVVVAIVLGTKYNN